MPDSKITAAERERYAEMRAELAKAGYVDIEQCGKLRVGTRVHHRGERWDDAIFKGTAEILALTEKPDSAWSREWGPRDVELIVLYDKPQPFGSRLSQWAQYPHRSPVRRPQCQLSTARFCPGTCSQRF